MFNLNDTMRYFLCPGRTDMRKGISSLCGVVHEKMKSEVKNGDVFIFIGSSRKLMKLLHAEDGGMVMYVKRLEAGRFKLPEYDPESEVFKDGLTARHIVFSVLLLSATTKLVFSGFNPRSIHSTEA